MARVRFGERWYELRPDESVLEGLLRNGVRVPNACRAGACQSCVMRNPAEPERAPLPSRSPLKETLQAQGYFLSCLCRPTHDLEVTLPGGELRVTTSLVAVDPIGADVLRVRLARPGAFDYRAGQYVTLLRSDGLSRSYSLASAPDSSELELHVRWYPQGQMSGWLRDQAVAGEPVWIQGPLGSCFYVEGRPRQPMLLAGSGTGLAPLWAVARDALARGHEGPIWLFDGGNDPGRLYLRPTLRELAKQHSQLRYRPCVLRDADGPDVETGSLDQVISQALPDLEGWRVFLCGSPERVNGLRRQAFLAGASLREIHADAFLPSAA